MLAYQAKELREKRGPLNKRIKELGDLLHKEQRGFTTEERAEFDKLKKDWGDLTRQIQDVEEARSLALDDADVDPVLGKEPLKVKRTKRDREQDAAALEESRRLALHAWVRRANGMDITSRHREACKRVNFNPNTKQLSFRIRPIKKRRAGELPERRDMGVATGAAGGFTVPQDFSNALEEAMLTYGTLRNVAEIMTTDSGAPMPWPTLNDTTNTGEWINENTAVSAQDATLAQVLFGAYKVSSRLIPVSYELLNDSAFDFAEVVGRLAGQRIGRSQNTRFTTGTGVSQAQGILTAAILGRTAAAQTVFTVDDFVRLMHAVDSAYREDPSCGWMYNDTTSAAVMLLRDTTGQPIFQASYREGQPDRLLNKPVNYNRDMPDAAAATKPVLFGAFNKFKIRDVGSIRLRRLDERYAEKDQTGFIAFARCDSKLLDAGTGPVKFLQMAA